MNWMLVLSHAIAMYTVIGAWCGYTWCRRDGDSVSISLVVGVPIGMLFWPFVIGRDDSVRSPVPAKKIKGTAEVTRAAREEKRRMDRELARERGQVEMIEMSVGHRRAMAELAERRRVAEEAV